MTSFDTNVVLRLLVEDDPEQCERAGLAFRHAVAGGGVFVSSTVLVEVGWVLRVAFILESSRDANAMPVLTFDERLAREPDVALVPAR